MTAKITLITPPDIFENSNISILLMNPNDKDQDETSVWLSENLKDIDINVYYYLGEPNVPWLLHALNASKGVYFNLDNLPDVSTVMMSYVLGKPHVFYTTSNPHIKAIANYINNQNVESITQFLERVLNDQRKEAVL